MLLIPWVCAFVFVRACVPVCIHVWSLAVLPLLLLISYDYSFTSLQKGTSNTKSLCSSTNHRQQSIISYHSLHYKTISDTTTLCFGFLRQFRSRSVKSIHKSNNTQSRRLGFSGIMNSFWGTIRIGLYALVLLIMSCSPSLGTNHNKSHKLSVICSADKVWPPPMQHFLLYGYEIDQPITTVYLTWGGLNTMAWGTP